MAVAAITVHRSEGVQCSTPECITGYAALVSSDELSGVQPKAKCVMVAPWHPRALAYNMKRLLEDSGLQHPCGWEARQVLGNRNAGIQLDGDR